MTQPTERNPFLSFCTLKNEPSTTKPVKKKDTSNNPNNINIHLYTIKL